MHISLLYIFLQLIVCDDDIFGIKYFGRIIPTPRLHLGNKDKELYCHINLRSSFTWTTIPNRKSMNIPKENIVKKVEVKVKGMTYKAFEYTNTLWFSDINNYVLPEYHIYVINLEDNVEDKAKQSVANGIGLGYYITDEKFSIVHCLYNDGKIKQRKFAIGEYNNKEEYGLLYFGGIPSSVTDKKEYKAKCKVPKGSLNWSCKLDKVIISNNTYDAKGDQMLFETSFENMIVPEKFLDFINETVLPYRKNCYYIKNKVSFIRCNIDELDALPLYHFVFDEIDFTIPMGRLFVDGYEIADSVLLSNRDIEDNKNMWIFGGRFLENYISVYDYDKSTIEFYTSKYVMKQIKEIKTFDVKNIIMIIGILCFGISLLLLYIKMKYDI